MDENNYIDKQLNDHECRLRRLEESDIAQRIELSSIGKSQAEIKLMMSEQSKEAMKQSEKQQNMLNSFTKDMLNYFKEKECNQGKLQEKQITENMKIKFYKTKQFWGVIGTLATGVLGGVLTYFGLK